MINCQFENGGNANLRHITVKAIVTYNGKVLLEKRAAHLSRGGLYDLPGGYLERGESAKEGVLRELFEETGIRGKVSMLYKINDSPNRPNEDKQNVELLFLVRANSDKITIDSESSGAMWYTLDTLPPEEEFAFDHYNYLTEYLNGRNWSMFTSD